MTLNDVLCALQVTVSHSYASERSIIAIFNSRSIRISFLSCFSACIHYPFDVNVRFGLNDMLCALQVSGSRSYASERSIIVLFDGRSIRISFLSCI